MSGAAVTHEAPQIAVIDDDASLLRAIGRLIAVFGYEVQSFTDARSFLDSGALGQVACILTDIHMPGLSGLELLDAVRAHSPATPVVVMTAYPLDQRLEEMEARGAAATLTKPIRAAVLETVLHRLARGEA